MDFELSEEQELLKNSLDKYLTENYDFDARRQTILSPSTRQAENWQTAAELGWLAVPFSDDLGGLDGGPIEIMLMFEEFGKVLAVEPYLETVILAGGILKRVPPRDDIREIIASMISGEHRIVLAHEESGTSIDDTALSTRATEQDSGYTLNGAKSVVGGSAVAGSLIVSALKEDGNLGLFLVEVERSGVEVNSYPTIDGRSAGEITFSNVEIPSTNLIAEGGEAEDVLQAAIYDALLALSAEQIGIMRALLDQTVEYTKQRKQFGTAISNFQVLQHRMADMYIALELAVSLMYTAAIRLRDGSPSAHQLVRALKVKADRSSRFIANSAFQLHGAIATTDECAIGHYLKRSAAITRELGGTDFQLYKYVENSRPNIEVQPAV